MTICPSNGTQPLLAITQNKNPSSQMCRWTDFVSAFDFMFIHWVLDTKTSLRHAFLSNVMHCPDPRAGFTHTGFLIGLSVRVGVGHCLRFHESYRCLPSYPEMTSQFKCNDKKELLFHFNIYVTTYYNLTIYQRSVTHSAAASSPSSLLRNWKQY